MNKKDVRRIFYVILGIIFSLFLYQKYLDITSGLYALAVEYYGCVEICKEGDNLLSSVSWLKPLPPKGQINDDWTGVCRDYVATTLDGKGGMFEVKDYPYVILNYTRKSLPWRDRILILFIKPQNGKWYFVEDYIKLQNRKTKSKRGSSA